jgi:hypothetical protein
MCGSAMRCGPMRRCEMRCGAAMRSWRWLRRLQLQLLPVLGILSRRLLGGVSFDQVDGKIAMAGV